MSPKTKKTTNTKVSFQEALDHGHARHSVGPWRMNLKSRNPKRRFQKGVPSFDDENIPEVGDDGQLVLIWESISREEALEKWDSEGWILEE